MAMSRLSSADDLGSPNAVSLAPSRRTSVATSVWTGAEEDVETGSLPQSKALGAWGDLVDENPTILTRSGKRVLKLQSSGHLGAAEADKADDSQERSASKTSKIVVERKNSPRNNEIPHINSAGSLASGKSEEKRQKTVEVLQERVKLAAVDRPEFTLIMGGATMVNVVFIGLATDYQGEAENNVLWDSINNFFLLLYLAELAMRMLTHGLTALQDLLTVLDTFIAVAALIESMALSSGFAKALPFFRLMRVFRLAGQQGFVQGHREIGMLISNGAKAMKTLFWACFALFFILASTAPMMSRIIGDSAVWNRSWNPLVEHAPFEAFDRHEYFGSNARTFFTLIQITTLSQWCKHVARPVFVAYPATSLFFFFFIMLIPFHLIRSILASIAQNSIASAQAAQNARHQLAVEDRRQAGLALKEVFAKVDTNGDKHLSRREIQAAFDGAEIPLFDILVDLNVPKTCITAENLVKLFDLDGDRTVDYFEMVNGIVKMEDEIGPHDWVMLEMRVNYIKARALRLGQRLERLAVTIKELGDFLQGCCAHLEQYKDTRELTDLRRRAMMQIRAAPPGEPPALMKALNPESDAQDGPPEPEEDQAAAFMSFTRRYFVGRDRAPKEEAAEKPPAQVGRSPFDEEVMAFVCGKGTLANPKPREEKDMDVRVARAARELDRQLADKYNLVGMKENPNLVKLKELLS